MNYNLDLIKQFKNNIKNKNDIFELKKQRNNFQYILFNLKTNKNQVDLLYNTDTSLNDNIELFKKYIDIIEKKINSINDKKYNLTKNTLKKTTKKYNKTKKNKKK